MSAAKPRLIDELKSWFKGHEDLSELEARVRRISLDTIEEISPQGSVLDGQNAATLVDDMRRFSLNVGAEGAVGTDVGFGKNPNEDAAVVVPKENFVAAIDGVGGYWGGDKAARFFGEGLQRFPQDFDKAIDFAKNRIKELDFEESLKLFGSSACFFSVRLFRQGDQLLADLGQAGDCRMMLFRADGDIIQSEDQSYINDLLSKGLITYDESLFHDARNRITNSVRLAFDNEVRVNPPLSVNGHGGALRGPIEVFPGDRILLMSDGISDNLTAPEIRMLIEGKDPAQALAIISEVTGKRMHEAQSLRDQLVEAYLIKTEKIDNQDILNRVMDKIRDPSGPYHWMYFFIFQKARKSAGVFGDGFKSRPSRDNRSLIVMDIV